MIIAKTARTSLYLALSLTALNAPLAAQERIPIDLGPVEPIPDQPPPGAGEEAAQPPEPDEGRLLIDLMVEPELAPGEQLSYEACMAEQDAARLRGEIIVSRRRAGDGEAVSGFDKAKWERDYAQRTQGVKTPDLDGLAGGPVYRADGSVFMVNVKVGIGSVPEPALIIDVEALPEAAPGSDADPTRIASRGVWPLLARNKA